MEYTKVVLQVKAGRHEVQISDPERLLDGRVHVLNY